MKSANVKREAILHATKALACGTVLAVAGVGMITFMIAKSLNVSSVRKSCDTYSKRLRILRTSHIKIIFI